MADVVKKAAPDRSKILMDRDDEVKYWTKHLGISRDELQRIVDKVGPSAAAIRKELGMRSEIIGDISCRGAAPQAHQAARNLKT